MDPLARAASWRQKAEALRRYAPEVAVAFVDCAAELEADVREAEDTLLSPAAAADYAGVSDRTLRQWVANGRLTNHGRPGKPLYRRSELPRRTAPDAGAQGGGYDPAKDAAALFARQRGRA